MIHLVIVSQKIAIYIEKFMTKTVQAQDSY